MHEEEGGSPKKAKGVGRPISWNMHPLLSPSLVLIGTRVFWWKPRLHSHPRCPWHDSADCLGSGDKWRALAFASRLPRELSSVMKLGTFSRCHHLAVVQVNYSPIACTAPSGCCKYPEGCGPLVCRTNTVAKVKLAVCWPRLRRDSTAARRRQRPASPGRQR